MTRASEHLLAIALANHGVSPTYIDDDEGNRYMTIAIEERGAIFAWYARRPGEEIGPFDTRFEAACKAMQGGWMPRSFFGERRAAK